MISRKLRNRLWLLPAFVVAVLMAFFLFRSPSHERDWKADFALLPQAEFTGDSVTIRNIRNFAYADDGTVRRADYYDGTFDISALTGVWYGISHFSGFGMAHTFLSFGFEGGRYVTISVEARLTAGQSYDPIAGLFRKYELMYLVGDERDIIGLRSHIRSERVYLYKVTVEEQVAKDVFLGMLNSVNAIYRQPRFYNTLTDNCMTNLLRYVRGLSWFERFFDYRVLLPGYSDGLAYRLGIIDNDRPLEAVRARARIDPAGFGVGDPEFSLRIRADAGAVK